MNKTILQEINKEILNLIVPSFTPVIIKRGAVKVIERLLKDILLTQWFIGQERKNSGIILVVQSLNGELNSVKLITKNFTIKLNQDLLSNHPKYLLCNLDNINFNQIPECNYEQIIYSSKFKDNVLIKKAIKEQEVAVYIKNKNLIFFDGLEELPLISIGRINFADQQTKDLLLEGLMLTTSAAITFNIPLFILRKELIKAISYFENNFNFAAF